MRGCRPSALSTTMSPGVFAATQSRGPDRAKRSSLKAITCEVIGQPSSCEYCGVVAFAHSPPRTHSMSTYRIHTIESAPERSRPVLRELQQAFGFIPNVAAAMAESPVLIDGF